MTRRGAPPPVETDGALLFGRYAFPPNELGYCGPDRAHELLERVGEGASGRALAEAARQFEGAWPYLELIAACVGADPLDPRVVRAYWLGGPLVERCGGGPFANSLEERFRSRLNRLEFERLVAAVSAGGVPHHTFHVFAVYPWVGLLREGRLDAPMRVLDNCRIRWGRVLELGSDVAVVEGRHLTWDGRRLGLGLPVADTVTFRRDGHALARGLAAGDVVSMHWDWVCDVLTPTQLGWLRRATALQLDAVNACAYSAPAAVLA